MNTLQLQIHGMDCAEEVTTLRAALSTLSGIEDLRFNIINGTMTIDIADGGVPPDKVIATINHTGMRAELYTGLHPKQQKKPYWDRWGRIILTGLSGTMTAVAFGIHVAIAGGTAALSTEDVPTTPWLVRILYLLATIAGAWFIIPKAWQSLLRLRPDMNLLMIVAVLGAIGIGEYLEAAMVAFLFALSLALEAWSIGRARRAIAALVALSPPKALIRMENGIEKLVDISEVPVGSTVIVKPGEKFPLDGKIIKGQTTVNQAPITGESLPVPKTEGSEVFAGTINEDGAIELITTKPAQDTTLARIIRSVEEAQQKRAPSEQWVEKFARYYTPSVMALAVLVAIVPPLLFESTWTKWFYEALVLLVIACPCALVISTPVSIVAALTAAARKGVLIKGGIYIELPARLNAIALDKTGTLTAGHPEVQEVISLSGHNESELLLLAGAVELRSQHPLAKAVVRYAEEKGIQISAAENFQAIQGKGATAQINGRTIWVGSHRMLEERGQETPEYHEHLESLANRGWSLVVVGEDHHVCGFIAIGDQIRTEASLVVNDLHAAGIQHIIMLTGDNQATAKSVADQTGIDEFYSELLPEDKVKIIEELVNRYGQVAMIGDGVNDAPALARSSLGIAMGAAGTDAAIETADIALMNDDLSRIPWLIRHSRRTMAIIHQNIIASLAVKAVFVVLAFAGYGSLWGAIAADAGVSLLVVFNALRLLLPNAENALNQSVL